MPSVTPALIALQIATVTPPVPAQQVPAQTPVPTPTPTPPPVESDEAEGEVDEGAEVTVVGQRERGSVPGDIQPEQVLRPGDIRAYGAASLSDLLTELAPQLGSGRGGEGGSPVVLLNGRRISGFRAIQEYPPESIERVDILPPEAAQQLGFRADQRVVNFVLRRRFNAVTAEVEGGGATQGDRFTTKDSVSLLRIMRERRMNVSLNYDAQTPIYEADRNIVPTAPTRPYSITGNLTPATGFTQIDAGLSALAGSAVTVAGVPAGVVGRPALSSFLGGVNPSDFGAYRTVSPATQNFRSTLSYAQPIFGDISAELTGGFDWTKRQSELGLATASLTVPTGNPFSPFASPVVLNRYLVEGGAREQTREENTAQLGFSLNGDISRWRWSMTGNYTRAFASTFTDNSFDLTPLTTRIAANDPTLNPFALLGSGALGAFRQDYARSLTNTANFETQVNGPLFVLPAGDARASIRTGFITTDIASRTIRSGVTAIGDNGRDTGTGQVRVDLPIANRGRGVLGVVGNLSANASYAYEQASDFGWLSTYSGGLNWSPIPQKIFILATVSRDENAPSINQLGDPVVVTPNARVFDFVRGISVDATVLSGGNPLLRASERRVTNLTFNARPFTSIDLNFNAEYTRTRTIDPVQFLSTPTAALEAAFPDRFLRDAAGQLIRVDNRPINVDQSDQEQLRWGFNFSRRLGSASTPGQGRSRFGSGSGAPEGAAAAIRQARRQTPTGTVGATGPDQRGTPATAPAQVPTGDVVVVGQQTPSPTPPSGRTRSGDGPDGPGGRTRGPSSGRAFSSSGFGGSGDSRVQLSVFHTWRFRDTLTIGPGIPVLDRLNGDATGFGNNVFEHQVQARGGVTKDGYGLRFNLDWQSGAFIRGGTSRTPVDIRAAPLTTVGLRSFVQFTPAMRAVREHPWLLGTRIELELNNLFDTRRRVTDATGSVPINFQPDLLDPVGRTISLSIRKLFFNRPPSRAGFGTAGALRR